MLSKIHVLEKFSWWPPRALHCLPLCMLLIVYVVYSHHIYFLHQSCGDTFLSLVAFSLWIPLCVGLSWNIRGNYCNAWTPAQHWDLGANTYDLYCGEYTLNTPRRNLLVTSWNNGWWLSPNFVEFEINQHFQVHVIVCLDKRVAVVDPLIVKSRSFKFSKKIYKGSLMLTLISEDCIFGFFDVLMGSDVRMFDRTKKQKAKGTI